MFMGVGLACQEILRGDGLKVLKNISVKQLKRREIGSSLAVSCSGHELDVVRIQRTKVGSRG